MKKRAQHTQIPPSPIPAVRDSVRTADLADFGMIWLADNRARVLSERTIDARERILRKLAEFAAARQYANVGTPELRAFLAHAATGSGNGVRYGDAESKSRPLRPVSVATHHAHLAVWFRFLVEQGDLDKSPMQMIRKIALKPDQIDPFNADQQRALIDAARRTACPVRDEAIIKVLLDTGLRASELCSVTIGAIDRATHQIRVEGKGHKRRIVTYGAVTNRALWMLLRTYDECDRDNPGLPLFQAQRGSGLTQNSTPPLTRSGLLQLIERIGDMADVTGVRCSPHTFRHTAAIERLRAGMSIFAVQMLLGHSRVEMTRRYVAYVEADLIRESQRTSPVDRAMKR